MGERWIRMCKATAVFGSSRPSPTGSSNDLDKFIAEAESTFREKCGTADLGRIINRAKARLAGTSWNPGTGVDPYARLVIMEYLLLGDPDQTKWTKTPKELEAEHASSVEVGGGGKSQEFPVSVQCEGSPVEGAIVSLWKEGVEEDEVFEAFYTDISGEAIFDIDPQTPGVMHVTVWGRDLKVYFGEVPVYIRGDANGDGIIDISDVVYLAHYLFIRDSPAPYPLEAGDANCDGVVDIADVVYLINFVFLGGPPPGC